MQEAYSRADKITAEVKELEETEQGKIEEETEKLFWFI